MSTEHWTDRLSAYLDGELLASDLEAADRHLAECATCRATLEQLRGVTRWAAEFEGAAPPRNLWPRIEGAVRAKGTATVRTRARWQWWPTSWAQAVAAGLALVLVGGGSWWLARSTGDVRPVTIMPATLSGGIPVSPAVRSTRIAAERYGRAVEQLEQALLQDEVPLDTATVRVVREKLVLIDRAIEEARAALERDPNSEYLADHFADMMRRKLELLRHTAWLVQS